MVPDYGGHNKSKLIDYVTKLNVKEKIVYSNSKKYLMVDRCLSTNNNNNIEKEAVVFGLSVRITCIFIHLFIFKWPSVGLISTYPPLKQRKTTFTCIQYLPVIDKLICKLLIYVIAHMV